ncbi:hypothetical protein, partial [Lactococcus sp. UBA7065]|uniref:hypothetical protein n=2 Tax=unclassified Lactococcus TaxID=2643510 RepID=UPI00257A8024
HEGVKVPCLTAWLYPIAYLSTTVSILSNLFMDFKNLLFFQRRSKIFVPSVFIYFQTINFKLTYSAFQNSETELYSCASIPVVATSIAVLLPVLSHE